MCRSACRPAAGGRRSRPRPGGPGRRHAESPAAGVGDVPGGVVGNGMRRATTMKLVAAFDHRDIFIDPNPDLEKGFAERKRVFALPRSSWQDYDKTSISKGGG